MIFDTLGVFGIFVAIVVLYFVSCAEGEYQASARLRDAAGILEEHPSALQLRFLQTVANIGNEKSTVVVLPVPMQPLDLLQLSR